MSHEGSAPLVGTFSPLLSGQRLTLETDMDTVTLTREDYTLLADFAERGADDLARYVEEYGHEYAAEDLANIQESIARVNALLDLNAEQGSSSVAFLAALLMSLVPVGMLLWLVAGLVGMADGVGVV